MPEHRLMLALCLLVPLAGCGTNEDDDARSLARLPSALGLAAHCMTVHSAVLQAGFGPLSMSNNPPDADETLSSMRDMADALPPNDTGQPALRDAFRNIVEQIEGVRGRGIEAAGALTDSAPYKVDVGVLQAWYTGHCNKDRGASTTR